MLEIVNRIPDVNVAIAMEPEELAGVLLSIMRERLERRPRDFFHLYNSLGEPFGTSHNGQARYPDDKREAFAIAFSEAWCWLEAQGLLIPVPNTNGQNGFRTLSRRAHKLENEQDFSKFVNARLLPKELLHPSIRTVVWGAFVRGEYDVAAFQAMKAVEVAVREAAGLSADLIGVKLINAAFEENVGVLTDKGTELGERTARKLFFAGAIGSYKNPHSHRYVELDDPAEAIEIVLLANHLLRIVGARSAAIAH